jgi:hypothetical protein
MRPALPAPSRLSLSTSREAGLRAPPTPLPPRLGVNARRCVACRAPTHTGTDAGSRLVGLVQDALLPLIAQGHSRGSGELPRAVSHGRE